MLTLIVVLLSIGLMNTRCIDSISIPTGLAAESQRTAADLPSRGSEGHQRGAAWQTLETARQRSPISPLSASVAVLELLGTALKSIACFVARL